MKTGRANNTGAHKRGAEFRSDRRNIVAHSLALAFALCAAATLNGQDPLPSWNDTAPKKATIDFVERVTKQGSPDFVKAEERIATFDNDGTLWVEQPNYTQVIFAIDQVVALAPQHPAWREMDPFKSILAHDREAMLRFSIQDFGKVVAVTHSGMTVQQFQEIVISMRDDWKTIFPPAGTKQ